MAYLRLIGLGLAIVVPPFAFVSCGTKDSSVYQVRVITLYESYRDGSDIWTGKKVSVELARDSYFASSEGITWHSKSERKKFDVLFKGSASPLDSSKSLIVVGVCVGKIVHGPLGPEYYVLVEECEFKNR